jgi:hypothetical protein
MAWPFVGCGLQVFLGRASLCARMKKTYGCRRRGRRGELSPGELFARDLVGVEVCTWSHVFLWSPPLLGPGSSQALEAPHWRHTRSKL